MKLTIPRSPVILLIVLVIAALLAGCGGSHDASSMAPSDAQGQDAYVEELAADAPAATAIVGAAPSVADTAANSYFDERENRSEREPALLLTVAANEPNQKIIKDATLSLEVEDLTLALSQISAIADQSGGYVLETRTESNRSNLRMANLKLAVPVDQFESAVQRVREAGKKILSEQSSGVDVTQEFVDTQSQLANLEATQARVREFLDQAENVEEALQVNARLTEIEGEISQLKGRLQYLSQRAAFSTITVSLQQPIVAADADPEILGWNPAGVARDAFAALTVIGQALATVLIWTVVVVLPLSLPVVLLALIVSFMRRRARSGALPTQAGAANAAKSE
jgi:outer membrane murein-binding lipoprotein Lpp